MTCSRERLFSLLEICRLDAILGFAWNSLNVTSACLCHCLYLRYRWVVRYTSCNFNRWKKINRPKETTNVMWTWTEMSQPAAGWCMVWFKNGYAYLAQKWICVFGSNWMHVYDYCLKGWRTDSHRKSPCFYPSIGVKMNSLVTVSVISFLTHDSFVGWDNKPSLGTLLHVRRE